MIDTVPHIFSALILSVDPDSETSLGHNLNPQSTFNLHTETGSTFNIFKPETPTLVIFPDLNIVVVLVALILERCGADLPGLVH